MNPGKVRQRDRRRGCREREKKMSWMWYMDGVHLNSPDVTLSPWQRLKLTLPNLYHDNRRPRRARKHAPGEFGNQFSKQSRLCVPGERDPEQDKQQFSTKVWLSKELSQFSFDQLESKWPKDAKVWPDERELWPRVWWAPASLEDH